MRTTIFCLLTAVSALSTLYAQEASNTITTATPFLLIAPDARAGGMGDIGVASSPDAYSLHWNASKFAFMPTEMSVAATYTPWLRQLTDDMFLGSVSMARRIDDRSAWAASLNFFNLGQIELTDDNAFPLGTEMLNEFSIDGAYALKLSDHFSMGVALRYIRSDLGIASTNSSIKAVNTYAVDVSGYYQSDEQYYGDFNGIWRTGFNISNLGPKVSYTDDGQENFIPTNLRLGGGFDFIVDSYNTIALQLEFNKLLVPSPSVSINGDGTAPYSQENVGFFSGVFQSFGDAPGGFKEELQELTWALGLEYLYDKVFALRAGYFNEHNLKGARKYFTLGSGFRFNTSRLDISYLFNASDINNPLENTLRFSLSFDLGDTFEIY